MASSSPTSAAAAAAVSSKAETTASNSNKIISLVDLVVCRIYQHAYQENEMRAEEPRILVSNITPDVKEFRAASKDESNFAKWGDIMAVAAARNLAKCESGHPHAQLTAQGVIFVEQRLAPSVRSNVTPISKLVKALENTTRHLEHNLTPVGVPAADLKDGYHFNWVWDYSTDVHPGWKTFPPGDVLPIVTPRNAGPHMIRSELLLYTRAARVKRDQYKHCKEYFDDAECSRGAECFFVHAISVANLGPKWGRPKPLPDSVRNKPRTAPIPRSLIAAAVAATASSAAAADGGGGGGSGGANEGGNKQQGGNTFRDQMFQLQGPPGGKDKSAAGSGAGGSNKASPTAGGGGGGGGADNNNNHNHDDDEYEDEEDQSLYVSIADVMLSRVYQRAVSSKAKDCRAPVRISTIMDELDKMRPLCFDSQALDKWQFILEVAETDVVVNNKDGEIHLTAKGAQHVEKILPDDAIRKSLTTHAKLVDALDGSFEHRAHHNYLWNSLKECSGKYERLKPHGAVPPKLRVTVHDEHSSDMLVPCELVLKTRATRVPRNTYVHCAHYYKRESCELGAICKYVHAVSLVGGKQWGKCKALPAEWDSGKADEADKQFVVENAKQAVAAAAVAAVLDTVDGGNSSAVVAKPVVAPSAAGASGVGGSSSIMASATDPIVPLGSKKSGSNIDVSSLLSPSSSSPPQSQPSLSIGSNGFAPIVAPSSNASASASLLIDSGVQQNNDKQQLQRFASSVLDEDDEIFGGPTKFNAAPAQQVQQQQPSHQQQHQQQQQQFYDDDETSDDDDAVNASNGDRSAGGGNSAADKKKGRSHQNRLYADVGEIPYERFDANAPSSETMQVEIAGGGKLASVPRNQILKTGAVRIERRLYKHCKDFFDEGECHRGHKCKYVHTAFLNSGPVFGPFAKNLLAQYQQHQAEQQQQQNSSGSGKDKKKYDVSLVDAMLCRLYQRAVNSSNEPSPTGTVRANFVGDDLRELKQITRDGNKFDRLKDLIAGAQDRARAYKGGADVALTAAGAQYVESRGLPRSLLSSVSGKVEDLVIAIATADGVLPSAAPVTAAKKASSAGAHVDVPAPRGQKQTSAAADKTQAAPNNAATTGADGGFGFSVNSNSLSIPAPNSKQPVGGVGGAAGGDLKFNSDFLFGGGVSSGSNSRLDEGDDDDDLLMNLTPAKLAQKQQQQQQGGFNPPLGGGGNASSDLQNQLRALERDKTRLLEELVRAKERSDFADQEMQLLREKNNALVLEVQRLKTAAANGLSSSSGAGPIVAGGGGGGGQMGMMGSGSSHGMHAFLPDRPHQVDFAACGLPQHLDPGTLVTAPERSPLREVAARLMRTGGSLLPRPSPVAGFTLESIDVLACDSTGFEARVKRLELSRKTAARATAPYLELESAERLHLYVALMERFLPRNPGAAPSQPNLVFVYQGTDLSKLSNVANGLLDPSTTGPTAGLLGNGINVSTSIEFAAKEATGEIDQSRAPPRRRADGCVPVVWCIAAVGAAFPVIRGDDFRRGANSVSKVPPGFDCNVGAINEINGYAGVVPRKDMQYQMLSFEQDLAILPLACLWLRQL